MADNVTLGSQVYATDDIGGINFPRHKVVWGADGVATDVSAAAPLPVVQTGTPALPTGAATETTLAALNTKIPASPATEGGNLATLVGRTPALGAQTIANSTAVNIASDQTVAVNQAGVSATGSLAALNATVALNLAGASGATIDLRGTFTATVTFQGTTDGTNWVAIPALPVGSSVNATAVTTATAAGVWNINANGLQQIRATATAYTSGTVTVVVRAMQAVGMVYTMPVGQATQAISGTVTANIGTGSIAAGTNAIGDVGLQYRANATGAATVSNVVAAATTNATNVKASAGRLLGYHFQNTNAAIRYVKFHNSATAPTAGAGVVMTVGIPANGSVFIEVPGGLGFSTGIGYTIVTGAATTDATAVAANDVVGWLAFA